MSDFRISQGARRPSLRATLLSGGQPVSLAGASVTFRMWTTNGHVVEGPAVIESILRGQVRFDWPPNSTNIPGTYQAEWIVEYPDERTLSVASDRFTHVRIAGTNIVPASNDGSTPGMPGSGPSAYTHNQLAPSDEWEVVHNLGMFPNVRVHDSAGTNVVGEILDVDDMELHLLFEASFAGTAHLS